MVEIGIGMPAQSMDEVKEVASTIAPYYPFGVFSFSVYGDLGDLPPYAALHAAAPAFRDTNMKNIGPLGVPVSLVHPEVIAQHSIALEQQLPKQTSVGIVPGAFLENLGLRPANLAQMEEAVRHIRQRLSESGKDHVPIYMGVLGPKMIELAGRLGVNGIKLGGSVNPDFAKYAKGLLNNPDVSIIMGAVSVISRSRKPAREKARVEVAKYLAEVGPKDPTLNHDDLLSLQAFMDRYKEGDRNAHRFISDALLDKHAVAGSCQDAAVKIASLNNLVDRFEFGTPHGLKNRLAALKDICDNIPADVFSNVVYGYGKDGPYR